MVDILSEQPSDAAIQNRLAGEIVRLSAEGLFSGLVIVARRCDEIANVSIGLADRSRQLPITRRTRFTLGSVGKLFTATAIGQLVDAGEVSFGDPVGKFFAQYPDETVRNGATIGMLLSHTAGLADFLTKRTPRMLEHGVLRASEFMPLYENDQPRFEPGTGWAYSNAGLALAGAILERVSGETYPDYLRKHVFAPTGMTDADPNNIPRRVDRLAIPYTRQAPHAPTLEWHEAPIDVGSPAGGAISSAADLVRFADALRGGRLISRTLFEEMTRTHGRSPKRGARYGYGFAIEDIRGHTVIGHKGTFPGVSTQLCFFLNAPYTVVALCNSDSPAAEHATAHAVSLVAAELSK